VPEVVALDFATSGRVLDPPAMGRAAPGPPLWVPVGRRPYRPEWDRAHPSKPGTTFPP